MKQLLDQQNEIYHMQNQQQDPLSSTAANLRSVGYSEQEIISLIQTLQAQ
jgi:hypothetical protein